MALRHFGWCAVCAAALVTTLQGDEPIGTPGGAEGAPAAGRPASESALLARAELLRELRDKESAVRKALQKRVTHTIEDRPLDQVVKQLGEAAGVNVWIDRNALSEEGIALDEPVSASYREVTVEQALARVLEPLSLRAFVQGEVVYVTTDLRGDEILVTRVYDVTTLLPLGRNPRDVAAHDARGSREMQLVQFAEFDPAVPPTPETADGQSEAEWLMDPIIIVTEGPWEDIDGSGGTLSLVAGLLTVRQTQRVHDQVAAVLDGLKILATGRTNAPVIELRDANYPHAEDTAVIRGLRTTVTIDYEKKPLQEVLDELTAKAEIPLLIDRNALDDEGVATDEPVSARLQDVTLETALRLILDQLGLEHRAENGALLLTTALAADERLFSALYVVRDLLDQNLSFEELSDLVMQETSGPWEDIDGSGGVIANVPAGALAIRQTSSVHSQIAVVLHDLRKNLAARTAAVPAKPQSPGPESVVTRFYPVKKKERAEAVLKAIRTFVAPESWDGEAATGAAQIVEGTIVVRNTVRAHRLIERFLKELEQAESAPTARGTQGSGASFFRIAE